MSSLCRLYVVSLSSRSLKLTRTTRLKLSHHMLVNCWYISPSIVVISYVVSMLSLCHLYVVFMSSLCRLYVISMSSHSLKLTCTIRLKLSHHMLVNCWYISSSIVVNSYVVSMLSLCHLYVVFMLSLCCVYVISFSEIYLHHQIIVVSSYVGDLLVHIP